LPRFLNHIPRRSGAEEMLQYDRVMRARSSHWLEIVAKPHTRVVAVHSRWGQSAAEGAVSI
jgi:hypothetical protein